IGEELAQVEAYLTIEQARYGEKLLIREAVQEAAMQYLIPSLTIQPLVENAIKHGLQPKEDGGEIILKVQEEADNVLITISDNGVGMDLTKRHPLCQPQGESIGLINVHERLCGQYGQGLEISSQPGLGTTVTIRLPKRMLDEVEEYA
ncbi:MAG TPA: histidine kinase, partial [Sporomusaceae bacterium]|nr:histidine kinase [Sporomusaceae bacterium]